MNSTDANSEALPDPTEREKWEKEIAHKERELSFKEIELELKKQEHAAASGWKNPLVVAIMATAVAALGNAVVTMTNGSLQRELEDQKSEQARIQEMIKTGDPDKAAENLKFLLEAGLISKPEIVTKLGDYLKKRQPGSGPTLPSASAFDGKTLSERINALKKRDASKAIPTNGDFSVENHILLDQAGNPVSIVEIPKKGSPIKETKAIVLHYDASGYSGKATANFIANDTKGAGSTHLLIDRDGKVIQLVPFDIAAFHVGSSAWEGLTGLNNYSLGIMFVNAGQLGQLHKVNDKWTSENGRVYEVADVYVRKNPSTGEESFWEQYTEEQIRSAERVIAALSLAYPSIEAVVGHSEVAIPLGRKTDPGPALPIERLRDALAKARNTKA